MIMITGGGYSGKREFAKENYNLEDNDILDGEQCNFQDSYSTKCLCNFHKMVKRLLQCDKDPLEFTKELCRRNPGLIVITDEIGCGIIPIDKKDRIWREAVGRSGCYIAEHSERVIRIICGIPAVIKDIEK